MGQDGVELFHGADVFDPVSYTHLRFARDARKVRKPT